MCTSKVHAAIYIRLEQLLSGYPNFTLQLNWTGKCYDKNSKTKFCPSFPLQFISSSWTIC